MIKKIRKKLSSFFFPFVSSRGFTLVELLIAVTLFAVVISIVSASFIQALKVQRSIVAVINANDNVSLVLEQMAREIRTGHSFCTKNFPIFNNPDISSEYCMDLADNELVFVNAFNRVVWYKFEYGALWKEEENVHVLGAGRDYTKLTADSVRINYFNLVLRGNEFGDGVQPRITISLSVSPIGRDIIDIKTNVQTTISPRLIDT